MSFLRPAAVCFVGLALCAAGWDTLPARTNDTPGFQYTPSPLDWREIPIYQIFTDRFNDGDPSNNTANPRGWYAPSQPTAIHGGDLRGVREKLDYIRMLGARAIWISPVASNFWGDYHGYAASDLNSVDPHWGTLQDLRDLVDAAHERGMYVILDVVQNHLADLATSDDPGYPTFKLSGYNLKWRNPSYKHAPPFDDLSRLHNYGNIGDWEDPNQVILGDFMGLDGVRTEDPGVRQDMIRIFQAWIAATDCDGFRVDTARHIEMGFWDEFLPAMYSYAESLGKERFLIFAEAWRYADWELAPYVVPGRFNSALYFPLQGTMENVFFRGQSTSQLTDRHNALLYYPPEARRTLVSFFDNHDMARAMSSGKLNGNIARLKLALLYLYTYLQIPCLYYGTEQGFDGGDDPYNREDMFDGQFEYGPSLGDNFNMTHELFLWVRKLNLLRRAYPALTYGDFEERWQTFDGAGLYVFSRLLGTQEVIVAFNTASEPRTAYYYGVGPQTTFTNGTVLVNALNSSEAVTVGVGVASGQITFTIPRWDSKIWVRAGEIVPLPPSVANVYPQHGETGVLRSAKIWLYFDQLMDTDSVQTAWTIFPSIEGTFSWDSSSSRLTFSALTPFAPTTTYYVRLGENARSAEGLTLGAPFEAFFVTSTQTMPILPLGNFVMDGEIDAGATCLIENSSCRLWAAFDSLSGALYVALERPEDAADYFIFADDVTRWTDAPSGKRGRHAGDGPYLSDWGWWRCRGPNAFVSSHVLEGVIHLPTEFGRTPGFLYLAVSPYEAKADGALRHDQQLPPSLDDNGDVEADEFLRWDLQSGQILVSQREQRQAVVTEEWFSVNGYLSENELRWWRAQSSANALPLYAGFDGRRLYVATTSARNSNDHFVLVTDSLSYTSPPPWAKYARGRVVGLKHFLADEHDNDFNGWFINDAMDLAHPHAAGVGEAGMLEGTIDLLEVFGRLPERLYLAAVAYETQDGGRLRYLLQTPPYVANRYTVDANEYYELSLLDFDTDNDGLPDLVEDANRNGLRDTGETHAGAPDTDGDGICDGDEWLAGTDPLDSRSVFLIRVASEDEFGALRFSWPAATGRLYTLESVDSLNTDALWSPGPSMHGTGGWMFVSDWMTNGPAERRFYRVRAQTAP